MSRYNDNNNNLNEDQKNSLTIMSLNVMKRCEKKLTATCKILNSNGTPKGTGFFCEIKLNNKLTKVLFTNNHVIDNYDSDIKIEYDRDIIKLKKENRFFYTNEDLDYSCIEILDSDNFNNYFKVDENINNNNPKKEYKYDEFVIIQYPRGDDVSFAEGYINNIQNNYKIFHSINTEDGSSGSPLILDTRNLKVIGIHCGKYKNLNRGVYMKEIIKDIEKQILDDNQNNIIQKWKCPICSCKTNLINNPICSICGNNINKNNKNNNNNNIDKNDFNSYINKQFNQYSFYNNQKNNDIFNTNKTIKFNPIGKYKNEYENKEYDLYTYGQLEENKYCW